MPWEVVDGLTIPFRLAGDPALDFCNTRAGWGTDAPKEYLRTPAHLDAWARAAGLVGRRAGADDTVLDRALAFRESLYAMLTEQQATAWPGVAAEIERARAAARFELASGRPTWRLPHSPEEPLLAVAAAAERLLVSGSSVGRCPGRGCGWLFLVRGGRRRWCSMAVCGNRAKARRHALRGRRT